MNRKSKHVEALIAFLTRLRASGTLEPEQAEEAIRSAKRLMHSWKVRDLRGMWRHTNELARIFLRAREK